MCYKQKCKVVSLNLAHPVYSFIHTRDSFCLRTLKLLQTGGLQKKLNFHSTFFCSTFKHFYFFHFCFFNFF